jgi:hypothetical protein
MPLIRIDAIKGRSKEQIRGVLAAAPRAMLANLQGAAGGRSKGCLSADRPLPATYRAVQPRRS